METTSAGTISILEALDQEDRFALQCALTSVGELMTREVVTLGVHQPVRDAIQLFSSRQFRHILVVDGPCLAGVLSDRDVLRSLLRDGDPDRTSVAAAMTRNSVTIRPHASISEAIHLLMTNRVNCLPVTGEGQVLYGILTTTDLLRVSFAMQRWLETRAPRLDA